MRSDAPSLEVSLPTAVPFRHDIEKELPALWSFDAPTAKWILEPAAPLSVDGVTLPPPGPLASQPPPPVKARGGKKGKFMGQEAISLTPETFAAALADERGTKKRLGMRVRKTGWWNVDRFLSCALLRLRVTRGDGTPLAGAMVYAEGLDYAGRAAGKTDDDGVACVLAQFKSRVRLEMVLASRSGVGGESGLAEMDEDWVHPSKPRMPKILLREAETGRAGETIDLGDVQLAK